MKWPYELVDVKCNVVIDNDKEKRLLALLILTSNENNLDKIMVINRYRYNRYSV